MEYEFEKIEGMSVGQVVDAVMSGDEIYVELVGGGFESLDVSSEDMFTIKSYLDQVGIYTRTKKPWWVGMENMPVIVSDNKIDWHTDIFKYYDDGCKCCYGCLGGSFGYMRPLTKAERDKIKVRD